MDTVYKTLRAEVRGINEDEGTVDMFIPVSTDSVDRDGEVVEPTAFKKTLPKFMKRPVLVSSHDYRDLTSQIGEWTRLKIAEAGLEGKPKYYVNEGNEQADWGFKLASKGMAAFSVGFIPKIWEDGDGVKSPRRTYKEVELLEISQVIVPSNREAIQSIRSKSVDPIVTEICDEVEKELVTKPEETEEFIRIPVDTGSHEGHRIRTIDISAKEGIKAIYCGNCKKVMTYLFAKDHGWTMEKARAWVKEHEKALRAIESMLKRTIEPDFEFDLEELMGDKKTNQAEILDELDYLIRLIDTEGMNEDVKKDAWELVRQIMRLSGNDIPVDIKELISANVESKPQEETLTYQDIQEAIRRIANK